MSHCWGVHIKPQFFEGLRVVAGSVVCHLTRRLVNIDVSRRHEALESETRSGNICAAPHGTLVGIGGILLPTCVHYFCELAATFEASN
eukprot:2283707-Amphidinium_carterae.1